MNLYEILSRKVYLSSSQSQRRRELHASSGDEEETDEDGENEAVSTARRLKRVNSSQSRRSSQVRRSQSKYTRPSFISSNRQIEDDDDLVEASNSYRRYRLLSGTNSKQARAEARDYFKRIVSQVDRIKQALVCFVCFHLAFSLFIDLLTVYEFQSNVQVILRLSETRQIDQSRLIKAITFALICPSLTVGILSASRWHPQRHLFSLNYKNSLFIISMAFAFLALDELATLGCHFFNQMIPLPVTISLKCSLVGFIHIYLMYINFDVKVSAISRQEAQTCLRAFLVMTTTGLMTALTIHMYYFLPGNNHSVDFLRSVINSLLFCRFFVSLNCATVFYLIWNGVGRLGKHTTISSEDFDDFLSYYDMNRQYTDQLLTLNCISLACQSKHHHNVEELNEDSFSIRTVKEWRKSCFAVAGSIIFSTAFAAEICHLSFTSIWACRYYPKHMSGKQIYAAHLTLFGSLLASRLFSLFKSTFIGHKTTVEENRELLGHYSWHRNCHRFSFVYLAHITANLLQLYFFESSLLLVFVTNVLFGVSLGFMVEIVCKFMSNYITITSSTIQSALIAAMCQLSILFFAIYYLLVYVNLTSPLLYINLVGSILAMLIKICISQLRCLVSTNGFDLVEMQPYTPGANCSEPNKGATLLAGVVSPLLENVSLQPARVSCSNLASTSLLSPSSTGQSNQHLSTPSPSPLHQPSSSSSARNSHTQLYWYQVAQSDSNAHRKSSAAAVIAYRIKYRLESIVSILK